MTKKKPSKLAVLNLPKGPLSKKRRDYKDVLIDLSAVVGADFFIRAQAADMSALTKRERGQLRRLAAQRVINSARRLSAGDDDELFFLVGSLAEYFMQSEPDSAEVLDAMKEWTWRVSKGADYIKRQADQSPRAVGERTRKAVTKAEKWQLLADGYFERNPDASRCEAAKWIAQRLNKDKKQTPVDWDYIRRKIKKPVADRG